MRVMHVVARAGADALIWCASPEVRTSGPGVSRFGPDGRRKRRNPDKETDARVPVLPPPFAIAADAREIPLIYDHTL